MSSHRAFQVHALLEQLPLPIAEIAVVGTRLLVASKELQLAVSEMQIQKFRMKGRMSIFSEELH